MSKFIHRAQMPQVDLKYLPRLVVDAYETPGVEFAVARALDLHSHQYIHHERALLMPDAVALKPLLVSADGGILDGNHRWYRSYHDNHYSRVNVIQLGANFDVALDWLETLPYVYHLDKTSNLRTMRN